ncbi:heparinase II/III-family protein [Massilia sp. MB5]|uniref:heparinase II/III domain-containing protein n=1 Tax=Massilia sp. MB5 TaxID=2919578 RepID=UPI001F0D4FB5|nr:heparinase II/III family protein [Massilia sp. MB5]UMR31805.1 heparinase II/III-family protein [Massilia sp. MB5]
MSMISISIRIFMRNLPAYALLSVSVLALGIPLAATASLPSPVKTVHPRVLATQADFDRLKALLPPTPLPLLPQDGGIFEFEISAGDYTPNAENADRPIFGTHNTPFASLHIRHLFKNETNDDAPIQINLQGEGGNIASVITSLKKRKPTLFKLEWDSNQRIAWLTIGDAPAQKIWNDPDKKGKDWRPQNNLLDFTGRAADVLGTVNATNLSGTKFFSGDITMHLAQNDFLVLGQKKANELSNCPSSPDKKHSCNVSTASRSDITTTGQVIALSYKVSSAPKYLEAAKSLTRRMASVSASEGGEYVMGARVGVMAILYDWLHQELNIPYPGESITYRDKLAKMISETIKSPQLRSSICGYEDLHTKLACLKEPTYTNWQRTSNANSIAHSYLGAHNYSAVSEIAMGLLAIAGETSEDVTPLLSVAYEHYRQGFFKGREYYMVDGGHHMGFSYGMSGESALRISMWRKALEPVPETIFPAEWMAKAIYPYIYGLRSDGSFPARGDDFLAKAGDNQIGDMAIWSANENGDKVAQGFYWNNILPAQAGRAAFMMRNLYYPQPPREVSHLENLPKSRHFRIAGEVLMRDKWDANATLLEFKSSNFMSENHQHLDQNSFSLYYKAPLLLDSGLYDDYGTSHWNNYYTRTIAHNSILVYDKEESFYMRTPPTPQNPSLFINDGGQWYKNPNLTYPTLEEAKPGGPNYVDGITNFEDGENYTYVRGNASKAYSASKMDQNNGFLRSVLYLRKPSLWHKPVTVIFDSVTTEKWLPATSLLHMATDPLTALKPIASGGGRYQLAFGAQQVITVRNQGGLANIQLVLPENANVVKVGGYNNGDTCIQMDTDARVVRALDQANLPQGHSAGDCRFISRDLQGNYVNFPHWVSANPAQDTGTWRVEIKAAQEPKERSPQYFMNVISVADNIGTPAIPAVNRLSSAGTGNAEVVQIESSTILAFNRNAEPATAIAWTISGQTPEHIQQASVLAMGMKPGTRFARVVTRNGDKLQVELKETEDGEYPSSSEGVVNIGF